MERAVHPDLPKVRLTLTTAALKKLGRLRQRLVKPQTALLNQLHALLTESYGSTYKVLFPKLKSKKALEFFHTFPTLDDALAELPRVQKLLGEEKARILAQAGKWGGSVYLRVLRMEVRLTLELIRSFRQAIYALEEEMKRLFCEDPQVKRLESVGGMGTTLALTILGHSGDFRRFPNPDAYAAYCGLAPTVWQSGQSRTRPRRRKRHSRALKQAFLQLALTQLRVNPVSRSYYERKRREGKSHWAALIALARQLSKVVFRMMTEGSTYPMPCRGLT